MEAPECMGKGVGKNSTKPPIVNPVPLEQVTNPATGSGKESKVAQLAMEINADADKDDQGSHGAKGKGP